MPVKHEHFVFFLWVWISSCEFFPFRMLQLLLSAFFSLKYNESHTFEGATSSISWWNSSQLQEHNVILNLTRCFQKMRCIACSVQLKHLVLSQGFLRIPRLHLLSACLIEMCHSIPVYAYILGNKMKQAEVYNMYMDLYIYIVCVSHKINQN